MVLVVVAVVGLVVVGLVEGVIAITLDRFQNMSEDEIKLLDIKKIQKLGKVCNSRCFFFNNCFVLLFLFVDTVVVRECH